MTPQPAMQAVVVKTTLKGEIVWKIQGPPDIDAYKPGAPTARRAPYNPTNVAIAPNGDIYVGDGYGSYYINQYNSKAKYIRTFGGKGSEPGKLAEPHGIWVDTRAATPGPRRRRSPQQPPAALHAGRPAHRLRPGLPAAVPLRRAERHWSSFPTCTGRVTLIDSDNQVIEHLGDSQRAENWNNPLRTRAARQVHPGPVHLPARRLLRSRRQIFVVEWVEVGRVTKLRKV